MDMVEQLAARDPKRLANSSVGILVGARFVCTSARDNVSARYADLDAHVVLRPGPVSKAHCLDGDAHERDALI
jgi:hypothetical protein